MRASRSDRRRPRRAVLAAALAVLLPGAAAAQAPGPPIPLIPPPSGLEPATPVAPLAPVAGVPLAPPAAGWSGDTTPPAADRGGALPRDFWRGTPRALAEMLLARLPATTAPALQALERRLLLSPGAAPEGPDAEGRESGGPEPGGPGGDLARLRAAALLRLGEPDAARAVIAAIPEKARGAAASLAVAADASAGDVGAACDAVGQAIHRDQGAVWQRALIACQALQNKTDQASLGLQLLAEQKMRPDDALAIAVDALAGRPAPEAIERLDDADPLLMRLVVAAGRHLPPALVQTLRPDLALTVANDDKAPAELRLLAAERAAACGALPVDRLAALYSGLGTAGAGKAPSGPAGAAIARARHFAAIAAAAAPAERLAAIVAFADTYPGRGSGGTTLAARLVAPALRDVAPDPGLAASAPTVVRLLAASGSDDRARAWIALAPAADQPGLRGILDLASGHAGGAAASGRVGVGALGLALRGALGEPVAPGAWSRLPAAAWTRPGPPAPPPAAAADLADAASAKRVGETVLAALLVAAPQGTLTRDPTALAAAVGALRRVGLDRDARALAVEAALAEADDAR